MSQTLFGSHAFTFKEHHLRLEWQRHTVLSVSHSSRTHIHGSGNVSVFHGNGSGSSRISSTIEERTELWYSFEDGKERCVQLQGSPHVREGNTIGVITLITKDLHCLNGGTEMNGGDSSLIYAIYNFHTNDIVWQRKNDFYIKAVDAPQVPSIWWYLLFLLLIPVYGIGLLPFGCSVYFGIRTYRKAKADYFQLNTRIAEVHKTLVATLQTS